jgi:hypothetical protein
MEKSDRIAIIEELKKYMGDSTSQVVDFMVGLI